MVKNGGGARAAATRALCLAALRDLGEATVSDVAQRTGLSRPTVETSLAKLAEGPLVEHQVDQVQSGEAGGRPARVSRFRSDRGVVAGIDVSGATVHVRLSDLAGRLLESGQEGGHDEPAAPSDAHPSLEVVGRALDDTLEQGGLDRSHVRAVGVGLAGIVRPDGVLATSPSVAAWAGTDVRSSMADALGLPVVVENDLSLAAVGESRLGALRGARTGVYVLTWHHVSARITIDGSVLRGRHDSAGEVGLLRSFSGISFPAGPLTQAIASFAVSLDRLADDPDHPDGIRALQDLTTAMTPAVAALMLAVDPDRVVLGGALGRFAHLIAPRLSASVNGFIEGGYGIEAVIGGSELATSGVAVGAVHRAFESFSDEIYGTPGVAAPTLSVPGSPQASPVRRTDA